MTDYYNNQSWDYGTPYIGDPTSSGSGAGRDAAYPWHATEAWYDVDVSDQDRFNGVLETGAENTEAFEFESYELSHVLASGDTLAPGQEMSPKIPPAYDGNSSFFRYEELVYDWLDITTLDPEKRGPSLKTRLTGLAAMHKPFIDRDKLKDVSNDENDGVEYFIKLLRKEFVKGAPVIFLWRLLQYLRLHRGHLDFQKWILKFSLMEKRLKEAWMDLFEMPAINTDAYNEALNKYTSDCRATRATPLTGPALDEKLEEIAKEQHKKKVSVFRKLVYHDLYDSE